MSEYKENTVGWHLNRLKEPLRTDALASMEEFNPDQLYLPCAGYANALSRVKLFDPDPLWVGAFWFFNSASQSMGGLSEEEQAGWDIAKTCAPDPVAEPEAWKFTGVELKDMPGTIPLGHFSMVQTGLMEYRVFPNNGTVEPAPPLNAMYVPERDDEDAVPPPPIKTERLDGFNPAVEGYKPPVCVTESQMLADALGKIKTLEGKIGAMVDLMDKMADKYQDLESRVRELSDDRTHLWTAIRDRSIPND